MPRNVALNDTLQASERRDRIVAQPVPERERERERDQGGAGERRDATLDSRTQIIDSRVDR